MTPHPPAAWRPAARDPLLWFALAMAWLWVLVPALINPGQQGDHFEQFTWAHSMEWGYHKHPPLPTWLLAIAIKLFGASPYATYGVAALMVAGTCIFTYLVARELLGARLASLAIVLWGLHWAFSWKAQLLNHNSVMMCCIAAAAWLAMQAARRDAAWPWWVALGLVSGLALLSKYQSAVPLVGLILALWRAGWLRQRTQALGLLLAVTVSLAVFAPHVVWMVQNDFVTLRYASSTVHQLDAVQRVRKLLSFSALHLRMLLPVLLSMGVLVLWSRRTHAQEAVAKVADARVRDAERRAWLQGLLGWPLLVLAVLCIAQGVRLQDHWGFQAVQFISLWLAWKLRALGSPAAGRLLVLAVLTHTLAMAVYSRSVWEPGTLAGRGRPDQFYPAQTLAKVVTREWERITPCPLAYVVGPTYEGGMVSAYSGHNPAILEMGLPERSPWVDLADLRRSGAVYVYSQPPEALPGPLPLHKQEFKLPGGKASLYDLYWTVVPPERCR